MERNSCGIALGVDRREPSGRAICGNFAVDHVDIFDGVSHYRIFLCADHLHMRQHLLEMIGDKAQ